MTRHIISLSADAYAEIRDYIPKAIEKENIDEIHKTVDVILSDAVILKAYDDGIHIDLGAKRIFIDPEEFERIVIF